MEMDTLQQLIEKRAIKKLDDEISKLRSSFSHRLLAQPGFNNENYREYDGAYPRIQSQRMVGKEPVWTTYTPRAVFYHSESDYWHSVKKAWLPIFIVEETKAFLAEHDKLVKQMDQLQSEVEEVRNNQNS